MTLAKLRAAKTGHATLRPSVRLEAAHRATLAPPDSASVAFVSN